MQLTDVCQNSISDIKTYHISCYGSCSLVLSVLFFQSISLQDLKGGQILPPHWATSSTKRHIEPHHQQNESRRIARGWLGLSTDQKYYSCKTHNMFRWDPRAGPTWIHEIVAWDSHQVGHTHWFVGYTILFQILLKNNFIWATSHAVLWKHPQVLKDC
jgi:hypothetical protein